jgi:TonB family protein
MDKSTPLRDRTGRRRWPLLLAVSIALHAVALVLLEPVFSGARPDSDTLRSKPVELVVTLPEPPPAPPVEEPPMVGQIVDVAPTDNPKRPDEARFLAEHEQSTERETRTEQFRVNPEVLHHEFSAEDELQFEDLTNVDAVDPSTGAQVGNDRFDPDEDGALAALPSPFQITNKDGLQKPVPASHKQSLVAGAPNNDRLDLDASDRLALNANKIRFANYLNRIRRLVNFYWSQQLHSAPGAARSQLNKPMYETAVFVILNSAGRLESIEVTRTSGSSYMDGAVLRAFEVASPFPEPPPQLIAKDGRVYLPNFDFTVTMGRPSAAFQGIDPRAGVQFPGILKLNR